MKYRPNHNSRRSCERRLEKDILAMKVKMCDEGKVWECFCGRLYQHVCDEASGCSWQPIGRTPRHE